MKKIIYLLTLLITLASCDSLVEEEVYSSITASNFYDSEDDLYTALVGVYDGCQNKSMWYLEFGTQEMTAGTLRHYWSQWAQDMTYTNSTSQIWNLWKYYYQAISRANAVLTAMEESTVDESILRQYEAEARFLRAHIYFQMVRYWGTFPLVTTSTANLDDVLVPDSTDTDAFSSNEYLIQTDRDSIYSFLVDEFKYAEENLPASYDADDAGRVTSGAASGMLAKVYLFMAGNSYDYNSGVLTEGDPYYYEKCAEQCEKVINSGMYSLQDNYDNVFTEDNNSEILFAIQYASYATSGISGEGNKIIAYTGVRGSDITPYAWKQCSVNESFYNDWVAHNGINDKRWDRTFLTSFIDADGDTVKSGDLATFTRPHIKKFYTDWDAQAGINATGSNDYDADWIILRYADVLLMYSEALNESSGPTETALKGVNAVRTRAGQPELEMGISQDALRDSVWNERKWELCYEGHIFHDCIRTGRLFDEFYLNENPGRKDDIETRDYTWPIPYNAIEANPSLQQNAGW